jgi:hypothetical protein
MVMLWALYSLQKFLFGAGNRTPLGAAGNASSGRIVRSGEQFLGRLPVTIVLQAGPPVESGFCRDLHRIGWYFLLSVRKTITRIHCHYPVDAISVDQHFD